jgi:hypothetical protein
MVASTIILKYSGGNGYKKESNPNGIHVNSNFLDVRDVGGCFHFFPVKQEQQHLRNPQSTNNAELGFRSCYY